MYKIRDWLYVGKYAQTRNAAVLKQIGIMALLELAEHVPHDDLEILYLDVTDGEALPHDLLKRGVAFIRAQKAAGHPVLVACGAGISRSVTFAMAALMEEEDHELFAAFAEVYTRHRGAQPHFELVKSLAAYHGQVLDLLAIWEGLEAAKQQVAARN